MHAFNLFCSAHPSVATRLRTTLTAALLLLPVMPATAGLIGTQASCSSGPQLTCTPASATISAAVEFHLSAVTVPSALEFDVDLDDDSLTLRNVFGGDTREFRDDPTVPFFELTNLDWNLPGAFITGVHLLDANGVQRFTDGAVYSNADLQANTVVGPASLRFSFANSVWGGTGSGDRGTLRIGFETRQAVPAPASAMLFLAALAGLAGTARRRAGPAPQG